MIEHFIPIQLAKYSNFILGSVKYYSKIKDCLKSESKIFSIESNNSYKIIASIDLKEINNQYIKDFPDFGYLNVYCLNLSNSYVFSVNISKERVLINQENSLSISFETEYEFCPIQDKYNSEFYYHYFKDNLSDLELNTINSSEEFQSNESKIGGYPIFTDESIIKEDFDFDNPFVLLLQLNNTKATIDNKKYQLFILIKQKDLKDNKFENIIYHFKFL